jgi:anti-sigma B factor antagonist
MKAEFEKEGNVMVVSIAGELDASSAPELRARFEELIGQGENQFVIDLRALDFFDKSGISALVNLFKRVRIGEGGVNLCNIKPEIMKLFELTRLNRVFDIYDSRPEAVASFES